MSDEDLIQIVREFRDGILEMTQGDPRGMCYAVCLPLEGFLCFHGIRCEIMGSDHSELEGSPWTEHWWIRMPDGRVLDPTYDQLEEGANPVYLGPPTKWHAPKSAFKLLLPSNQPEDVQAAMAEAAHRALFGPEKKK